MDSKLQDAVRSRLACAPPRQLMHLLPLDLGAQHAWHAVLLPDLSCCPPLLVPEHPPARTPGTPGRSRQRRYQGAAASREGSHILPLRLMQRPSQLPAGHAFLSLRPSFLPLPLKSMSCHLPKATSRAPCPESTLRLLSRLPEYCVQIFMTFSPLTSSLIAPRGAGRRFDVPTALQACFMHAPPP